MKHKAHPENCNGNKFSMCREMNLEQLRSWSNESNISPSSVKHSCSVRCWIHLTTYCTVLGTVLGTARCCSTLFDGNQKCWESNWTFLLFEVFISQILWYVCTDAIGHSAGAHKTLEMLDWMLDAFDHPEQSSTEQGRAKARKVVRYSVKYWIRLTRAL